MIFRFINYSALGKTRWEMALSLMHEIFGKVNEIFGNLIHSNMREDSSYIGAKYYENWLISKLTKKLLVPYSIGSQFRLIPISDGHFS